jgi:hypothetical protein
VNNTEKLDDVRRRLAVTEVRLVIIQRAAVVLFEHVVGGKFPPGWLIHDDERAILHGDPPARVIQRAVRSRAS